MTQTSSLRFPALEKPVNEFIREQENKKTLSKTRGDIAIFMAFLKERNEKRKLEEIPPEHLNHILSEFIITVKRKGGDEFEPSSLTGFLCSFDRHLKAFKYPKNLIEDLEFEQILKALKARRRQLKKEGKGNRPNAAEVITDEEVNILYMKNLLGITSAQVLLNTLWFMNSIHFGLRGCDEHRQMTWEDIQLIRDVDGTEYLEYSERQTDTRTAMEIRNIRSVKPKAFATQDGPDERNPVSVYKICREKRPTSILTTKAPFYPSINYSKDPGRCWFKASAMAVNKLNSLRKTMVNKSGLDEKRRLTNHNARKTVIQKPNDSNVPPTHIMQLSGHRNVLSVNYSSVSKEQQVNSGTVD